MMDWYILMAGDFVEEMRFSHPCPQFEWMNKHGLTSHQSQNLLERLGRIIEMGQRLTKKTTH